MKYVFILTLSLFFITSCDNEPQGELIKTDLVVGTGDLGTVGKTWEVHYVGRLKGKVQTDSTIFESTYADNKPFSFVYDGTLQPNGFEEGIGGMQVGGKRKITIPYQLGFPNGIKNSNGTWLVPPKQDIIYEVELLSLPVMTYTDLTVATGALVENGKLVKITYEGRLKGSTTVFDRNTSGYSVRMGGGTLITGFEQGLLGMRAGSSRRIVIPPHLGYGSAGAGYNAATGGYTIPPHATIEFDVNVISVE